MSSCGAGERQRNTRMLPDSQQEKQQRGWCERPFKGGRDTMTLQDEKCYELRSSEIPRGHGEAARTSRPPPPSQCLCQTETFLQCVNHTRKPPLQHSRTQQPRPWSDCRLVVGDQGKGHQTGQSADAGFCALISTRVKESRVLFLSRSNARVAGVSSQPRSPDFPL